MAAAEEERFTRRKHGKRPVPFSTWELPEHAIVWCLTEAGVDPAELDAVAYSYDPALVEPDGEGRDPAWEQLRTTYAQRAPDFLRALLPGYDSDRFHVVRHRVAHAASAGLLAAVTNVDGTARVQTVDDDTNANVARLLRAFDRRTGVPALVNTSLNTAGRPMVDTPRDALELFGSSPVDALAIDSFLVRR